MMIMVEIVSNAISQSDWECQDNPNNNIDFEVETMWGSLFFSSQFYTTFISDWIFVGLLININITR